MTYPFTVSLVGWYDGEVLLKQVREAVFIREQGVPPDLEWDRLDKDCCHALVLSCHDKAVGCGRISSCGHIGRIAVLQEWRKQKVGTAIMAALLNHAHAQGYKQVDINAQIHAVPFYRGFGFVEEGCVFMDAGLPHIRMRLLVR